MSTVTDKLPLQFLKKKIEDIRSALFFSQDSIVKMPASIITVLRIDDEGFLWFFTKRPLQGIAVPAKEFPARLDFFRKKIDYFLQVVGRAVVVDEKEIAMDEWADISTEIKNNVLNELILMKVKILSADYFENEQNESKYWLSSALHKIQQWLFLHKLGYNPFKHTPAEEEQYVWNRA